jgi:hypothetical protein
LAGAFLAPGFFLSVFLASVFFLSSFLVWYLSDLSI